MRDSSGADSFTYELIPRPATDDFLF